VRFPESWSSTSLAKNAVLGTAEEIFVLDNAFALIEGQPAHSISEKLSSGDGRDRRVPCFKFGTNPRKRLTS
jgi:hypothetical protein